jgi:hypothetical protein
MRSAPLLDSGLDWAALAAPLARAEDALARLDERLARSPLREGFLARMHFVDAANALRLEGGFVVMEDLVLRDAGMDARAPSHELTRAHDILRLRRRVAAKPAGWAMSDEGLAALRAEPGESDAPEAVAPQPAPAVARQGDEDDADEFAHLFADVDAALARAERVIAGERAEPRRDPMIYDPAIDEGKRMAEWRAAVFETAAAPPTLACARALEAWERIGPLEHRRWLGPTLGASLLRERGKMTALPALCEGLAAVPPERRRARGANARLIAYLAGLAAAGEAGLRHHDRWAGARAALIKKCEGRRESSMLRAAVDVVLARPLVTAAMLAKEIDVTERAALNLVSDLGLRETTGRKRYRAWAVI